MCVFVVTLQPVKPPFAVKINKNGINNNKFDRPLFLGSDLSRLEYLLCTYIERVSRYARSKPKRYLSIIFIRSKLWAINCSSFDLKAFSFLAVYGLFSSATKLCLDECRASERKAISNILIHATRLSIKMKFQRYSERKGYQKNLDAGLGNIQTFSTQYCFGPS
jgi:hypothetical protein